MALECGDELAEVRRIVAFGEDALLRKHCKQTLWAGRGM